MNWVQKSWKQVKLAFGTVAKVISDIFGRSKRLYSFMKSQIILRLPDWKQEAAEYSQEWHDRISHDKDEVRKSLQSWKRAFSTIDASPEKLHEMLFEERSAIGRSFGSLLIILIFGSVLVVMLDSVEDIHRRIGWLLDTLEWFFTIVFTIEYFLRIYSSKRPIKYMTSFFGIIDLITILPTYIGVIFTGAHTFLVLRVLRVLRIFRLLKLVNMLRAGSTITNSLNASKEKIAVFLIFILLLVTIMGSILYVVESGSGSGFTSIPRSIYWAIVTVTTVGYGDIAPYTWIGQLIAALVMITGYAVIAVPTGIVSAEFIAQKKRSQRLNLDCARCGKRDHEKGARYCCRCGRRLIDNKTLPLGEEEE